MKSLLEVLTGTVRLANPTPGASAERATVRAKSVDRHKGTDRYDWIIAQLDSQHHQLIMAYEILLKDGGLDDWELDAFNQNFVMALDGLGRAKAILRSKAIGLPKD